MAKQVQGGVIYTNRQEVELQEALEALEQIGQRRRSDWLDWLRVGRGLLVCRKKALDLCHTDVPRGGHYARTLSTLLAERKLCPPLIDKDDRAALLHIMEQSKEVVAWRNKQAQATQDQLNNPRVVWKAFQRDDKAAKAHASGEPQEQKTKPENVRELKERVRLEADDARHAREQMRKFKIENARLRAEVAARARLMARMWEGLAAKGVDAPVGEDEARREIQAAVRDMPLTAIEYDDVEASLDDDDE